MSEWVVIDAGEYIHVVPEGDSIEHNDEGDDCICGPSLELIEDSGGAWLVTHHSLDGREQHE